MLAEFLKDYLPIILFLIIALGLSLAFVAINYIAAPKNLIQKNFQLMNVVLNLSMTLEWNLMLDFIWLQYYL